MSGLTSAERMGAWLSENSHQVLDAVRCTRGDGRILAKVCDVAGLRWVWFVGSRTTRGALIDEIRELAPLPTIDGQAHPEEIESILEQIPPTGHLHMPEAYPAERDYVEHVNCPKCHARFRVSYEAGSFGVAIAPPREPLS